MSDINKRIHENSAKLAKVKAGQCGCMVKTRILKALLAFHPQAHVLAVWRSKIDNDLSISAFRVIIDKLESEGYISLSVVGEDNHCNVFPHLTETGKTKAIIGFSPCPTCATLRKVAEYHWHEWVIGGDPAYPDKGCTICNGWKRNDGIDNPTYIVQTIRKLLEDLGELDGFRQATWKHCITERDKDNIKEAIRYFDILTSNDLMQNTVDAYLDHRVREVA